MFYYVLNGKTSNPDFKKMLILAIETSCDETSVAILKSTNPQKRPETLANVVSSQVSLHAQWGGVVPNLAAREHLKNIVPVIREALKKSSCFISDIDVFAVTKGPGLIPALLIGTNVAKTLSYFHNKPLIGIHHIEGHIFAALAEPNLQLNLPDEEKQNPKFPVLCLVVSGGHTQLILMEKQFEYQIIGQTQDDAAGEAFDKVAKILGLGYPGGPAVSKRAELFVKQLPLIKDPGLKSELEKISFPRPMLTNPNLDFSFSGLKTSVLYFMKKLQQKKLNEEILELHKNAVCHEFQKALVETLAVKTARAIKKYSPKTTILVGGVAANTTLRHELRSKVKKMDPEIDFLVPPLELCGDNAAMIGTATIERYYFLKKQGKLEKLAGSWKTLEAEANLKL